MELLKSKYKRCLELSETYHAFPFFHRRHLEKGCLQPAPYSLATTSHRNLCHVIYTSIHYELNSSRWCSFTEANRNLSIYLLHQKYKSLLYLIQISFVFVFLRNHILRKHKVTIGSNKECDTFQGQPHERPVQ